ncbi:MAG: discoidin domain-containing protein [Acidobacteria bacterium]|nr:discoidin domain-containing protein [Acidobacteriota bacterium]
MKFFGKIIILLVGLNFAVFAQAKPKTFCNPLNLDYHFVTSEQGHRTAADPVITLYKNDYFLFATASGGYWFSSDMREWTFIVPVGLPMEKPAPAILILGDKMYYTAHRLKEIYESDDPKTGVWRKVADVGDFADPAFFLDDKRLYLYYGASFNGGISVVEFDPQQNFKTVSEPVKLMGANSEEHGWEGAGEDNLGYIRNGINRVEPWIEGSWMTKHDSVYYLQYSAPGTIWKTYADGVYTSKFPNKDFIYQSYSPFSYKPGGFIGSAGHAATFQDKAGNYWRVVTMVISVAHKFERRLGIFPAGFDADGVMRTNTYLGDYPQFLPDSAIKNPLENNLTGWMLLSFGKKTKASSTLENHPAENAFDEEIRTVWSAKTGDRGEWLEVDLDNVSRINAVQINFAEQDAKTFGRATKIYQQYTIETSADGKKWTILIDKSRNLRDVPHDYIELKSAKNARYLRLTNISTPASGKFAVRDLRVFGKSNLPKPSEVKNFTVRRDEKDSRKAALNWQPSANAMGYVVRFGIAPGKLYGNYQIVKGNRLVMNGLNKNVKYFFSVDAAGEGGVTKGKTNVSPDR